MHDPSLEIRSVRIYGDEKSRRLIASRVDANS